MVEPEPASDPISDDEKLAARRAEIEAKVAAARAAQNGEAALAAKAPVEKANMGAAAAPQIEDA